MISDKEITPMTMMEKVCIGLKKGNKAMSDKMPDELYAYALCQSMGIQGHNDEWLCHTDRRVADIEDDAVYIHFDIHEKAVKERDALKSENERLRGAINDIIDEYEDKQSLYILTLKKAKKALQGGE